jgi:hypothetical protein
MDAIRAQGPDCKLKSTNLSDFSSRHINDLHGTGSVFRIAPARSFSSIHFVHVRCLWLSSNTLRALFTTESAAADA